MAELPIQQSTSPGTFTLDLSNFEENEKYAPESRKSPGREPTYESPSKFMPSHDEFHFVHSSGKFKMKEKRRTRKKKLIETFFSDLLCF